MTENRGPWKSRLKIPTENPGPCPTAFESSFQVQSLASSSQIHADRKLHHLEVQKPVIQHTSERLYGLRSNNRLTDMTLFGKLKDLGIYRYRGKRAGRYRSLHSESNQHSSFNNTRLCMTSHEKPHLHNDVNISRSYRVAVLPSVLLCNVRANHKFRLESLIFFSIRSSAELASGTSVDL